MKTQNLNITRGDTSIFSGTIKQSGAAFSLTGCTMKFTVKNLKSDADGAAVLQLIIGGGITVDSAPNGTFTITIPANAALFTGQTEDKSYYYDLQITTASSQVFTAQEGSLLVLMDVTTT